MLKMSTILQRLLAIQAQINELIAEVQGSEPKAPNAPKKIKRTKSLSSEDKEALKESGADAAKAIEAEKPKRVLSPEHLEKLKAGREVAKARKAAEKAAEQAASNA